MRTTIMLALGAGLSVAVPPFSNSGLAAEKGAQQGIIGPNTKNKLLGGPDAKAGKWSWQPKQYATDKDRGTITGGPAKGARGFSWGVKPATGGGTLRQPPVKSLAKPAKPETWAHQGELKSGKANLNDHAFETPKRRRPR